MVPLRLALLLTVAALLAPGSAHASLVFDRGVLKPSVWIAADDGSGARRLAAEASGPRIADDGTTVVFSRIGSRRTYRPDLMAVPADASAAPRVLARGWRDPTTFAWSHDGRTIATVVGPELGPKRLVLVDVATGSARTVARGFFAGVSFSPDGTQLIYARAPRERFPYRTDLYDMEVTATASRQITFDHVSQYPLWGPTGEIVYVRLVDAARRKYGPKNELYLLNEDRSGMRRLTRTKVDQLLQGLTPTAWSADGSRLLAEFGGQDTSYAETVDPATGAHKPVARAEEQGLVGMDLSADGTTILAATGGFDPGSHHDVVAVPYGGGAPTVLARNAFQADWNR